ncbi:MAG: NAD-dependent epimerase/dehydratase family protein [Deltaproteobacteria bacterium]|nr:NAD-dependent epimerase/dehydratase family protein [Deltaproteobacteria bacterium]
MAKTAFVTGGTGFIGINLVELLVREGWRVTAPRP